MRRLSRFAVLALALVALAGCSGSSSSSSATNGSPTTHLAKTKFVLHAGLAFGAFHRYIYKPLQAGKLTHPFTHKIATLKAAAAAVFAYHEVKLALADAQSSKLLSKLVAPLTALQSKLSSLGSSLKSGSVDASTIGSAASDVTSIGSLSAAAGQPVQDISQSLP